MVNELYHHGIKGQKWGVRRYRNEDGTLTPAGQKRYGSMTGKRLHRTLKREFRNQRAKVYGFSNRWMSDKEIGEHGTQVREKYNKETKKNLEKWQRDAKKLDSKLTANVNSGKMSIEEYDRRIEAHNKRKPPSLTKKYGKKHSLGRIQDLGYSKQVGRDFVERMFAAGYTLSDI